LDSRLLLLLAIWNYIVASGNTVADDANDNKTVGAR
jgi:hypothetical protein